MKTEIQKQVIEENNAKWQAKQTTITLDDAYSEGFENGKHYQAERMYSEEDLENAYYSGWGTRERFDDISPEIVYPKGLDYEEKQEYAFKLWFEQFKKK